MSEHDPLDEVIGEIHALLKGDTGFKMAKGDVEFFDAGTDDMLVVDIRGRRYEITVRDVGLSMRASLGELTGKAQAEAKAKAVLDEPSSSQLAKIIARRTLDGSPG